MTTALIVIDAQRIYTQKASELYCRDSKATVRRINSLVAKYREHKLPIILVRHVHKADGSDLGRLFDYAGTPAEAFNFKEGSEEVEYDPALVRPPGCVELTKNRYSAFVGTQLLTRLRELAVQRLTICGFMTNFCCESTARHALDLDYFVDFVVDATGTPGTDNMSEREIRKTVAELLAAGFARVFSTQQYLKRQP